MKSRVHNVQGFSMVELLAVLALTGIVAAAAGMMIMQMVEGYSTVRRHAVLADQAELALSRIAMEVRDPEAVASGGGATLVVNRGGATRTVSLVGDTLSMSVNGGAAEPLMRRVAAFNVQPNPVPAPPVLITVTITPEGGTPVYQTSVFCEE